MYVMFFLLWIIFNGRVTVEIVIFGLVIAAAMYWFVCKYMDVNPKRELDYFKKGGYLVQYICLLIAEIVKANFATMKLVCSSRVVTEPVLVQFDMDFKSNTSKFMLANAITLTPGTITVSVEGNRFTVHCLDKSLAEGINTSAFVDILHKIES
jgi:multicomponent Na+:H+ antiporter subunit E